MLAPLLLLLVGIPVTDPVVIAKCGSCHPMDAQGNMQRVSYARATPEGWQAVLKRKLRTGRITMTQQEARDMVKYLSDTHGLAPEESKPVMYETERRVHDETGSANEALLETCAKCHTLARALSWRRSADDWKEFAATHAARYHFKLNDDLVKMLADAAPLETPEWVSWAARKQTGELTGRWLVTAHLQGRGQYCGEVLITAGSSPGEFLTRARLRSVNDGSVVERAGRITVYAGHEWRGRSNGTNPSAGSVPDDPLSDARETMWISPDGSRMQGRWFWGQYQEFGFDVEMQRAAGSTLLALDVPSLKAGSAGNRVRLIGDHFPAKVVPQDVTAGAGVRVRRILSNSDSEIVAELDVAPDAVPGRRDVALASSRLPGALTIYDRIDYIRVMPDSAMAAFGNATHTRGYRQFEAIAYQRGPDGRLHTPDDLELGPVKATWSMEVFYETDSSDHDKVGSVSQSGFFTPAAKDPGANYDIWVIATAQEMTGKSYVVVTIPTYSFQGRTYVRELDRWIEEP
jgi:quinohemoprotein amine dehydrogenase